MINSQYLLIGKVSCSKYLISFSRLSVGLKADDHRILEEFQNCKYNLKCSQICLSFAFQIHFVSKSVFKNDYKGFRPLGLTSMQRIGYFQIVQTFFGKFLKSFWNSFGGFFWRNFYGVIFWEKFFERIFWEDFLGRFFGRIFW